MTTKKKTTKKLLFSVTRKDFDIQTFRGSGPGGQHRNKTDSAVRIIHKASGAVGESQSGKSQHRNKRLALKRLAASTKFKVWSTRMVYEITSGKTIEARVEETFISENMKIEGRNEQGQWAII